MRPIISIAGARPGTGAGGGVGGAGELQQQFQQQIHRQGLVQVELVALEQSHRLVALLDVIDCGNNTDEGPKDHATPHSCDAVVPAWDSILLQVFR